MIEEMNEKLNIIAKVLGYRWTTDDDNTPMLIPKGTQLGVDIFLDDDRIIK